jgi:tyrosine-protein phosphatase SIW14
MFNESIFEEYRRFSFPKSRAADQQFIELFDLAGVEILEGERPDWAEIRDERTGGRNIAM